LLLLARERRGWERHDLARRLRCSSYWIAEVEADDGVPSALTFETWLDALDVYGEERQTLEAARRAARAG
jgi:transcriptional regulator with XRE-family HTH domain